jgi:hypothetical protein
VTQHSTRAFIHNKIRGDVEGLPRYFPSTYTLIFADAVSKQQKKSDSKEQVPSPWATLSAIKSAEKKKTIAIIGGGSMGSLVGGRIASTGLLVVRAMTNSREGKYNVEMLSSWKEHVETINKTGLKVRNLDKTLSNVQLHAATNVSEILERSGAAGSTSLGLSYCRRFGSCSCQVILHPSSC